MSRVKFFEGLKRMLDLIHLGHDNEALRHDLIIYPMLTSPYGLGWFGNELIPQQSLKVNKEVVESYIWRGATPNKKRPDLIIVPCGMSRAIAVVEEKKKQLSIQALERHLGQLTEYQYLHNVVWGLLSDGEGWILKKNNEIHHRFSDLNELEAYFDDLKNCIGRKEVLMRLIKYNTADIVAVAPTESHATICSISTDLQRSTLSDFFLKTPIAALDLMHFLGDTLAANLKAAKGEYESNKHLLYFIRSHLNFLLIASRCSLDSDKKFEQITGIVTDNTKPTLSEDYVHSWQGIYQELSTISDHSKIFPLESEELIDFAIRHEIVIVASALPEDIRYKMSHHPLFESMPEMFRKSFLEVD